MVRTLEDLWTATGKLWGGRVLTVQTTRPVESYGALALATYEVLRQADVLTISTDIRP